MLAPKKGPVLRTAASPLPPSAETLGLPNGWFVAALSQELARGRTLTTRFMSSELVLYRTASGQVRATAPYCPHLGAHLGQCGRVDGELLRCDFHHFCFDGDGACKKTGYGTRPPPSARLQVYAVREQHGVILVHFDPNGRPPTWEIPQLDGAGWSPPIFARYSLRGHPQETTENCVDLGHFAIVHGYTDVRVLQAARVDGARLNARYAMTRGRGLALSTEFDVHVHGLGYSLVEVDVTSHGFRSRHFVFATPTEPGRIELRIAVSVKESQSDKLRAAPRVRRLLARLIARFTAILFAQDIKQDFRFWEHKRYLSRPALAAGDGPIGLYRRWARQFYVDAEQLTAGGQADA